MNKCVICNKEISDTATTCSPKCRQKLYRQRKSNEGVTLRNVTPETGVIERLALAIENLNEQLETRDKANDATLLAILAQLQNMSFTKTSSQEVQSTIPFQKPLVIENDDMPVLEVKTSTKSKENTSQNFLNSIMNLGGS